MESSSMHGKPIGRVMGADLSNKTIEIYLPRNSQIYPTYFPYWLQVNGVAGKAKIRIIDSGSRLKSPNPLFLVMIRNLDEAFS